MTLQDARVSVAVATHNGERFIADQLESILAQSLLPSEIVVSDDASTDATLSIVASVVGAWKAANPVAELTLTVLHNPVALGVAANFERALHATTGDFVALSDQDDKWRADRIEVALRLFASRPHVALVHSDATLVDAAGLPIGDSLFAAYNVNEQIIQSVHDGNAFEVLARRTIVTGAATMVSRALVERATPIPPGWLHDEWLAIVAAASGQLDVIDERLIDYRQHDSNEIGAGSLNFVGKLRRMLQAGSERNSRLLTRATSLAERFAVMPGIDEALVVAVCEKLAHEQVRSSLGVHRLTRVRPVLRELRTGRYSAFGRGVADAARDLLQPLESAG
jgi:glycosyltransferase involved in cell wall biosynthesis